MDKSGKKDRRSFLFTASYTVGAIGLGATVWPFIDQMNPDSSVKALASTEVDISQIEPGKSITVLWRGKPVFIKRRTPDEISDAKKVKLEDLKHPEEDEDRVNKEELSTYEDLANEKWKGRLLVRSSSNSYNQALMSSIVANLGSENTTKWSEGVVANFARNPKGNDRDQVKAIAAGQGDIAIVNSYYIGLLLASENEEELNAGNAVSVFFPNQGEGERGAHVNVSGIAIAKNSPNRENAIELIRYLISDEAQKTYVGNTYEFSVNPNIKPDEIVQAWGEFKKDPLDLNMLGEKRDEAIRIFDKTGWK